ncbi:DUF3667 domain-containing protein [Lacinutrix chionoecetis]
MSIKYNTCKNCDGEFKSNFQFCPHCGMKDKEELTLGVLFYNTVNNYLLYDSKFFKSFVPLMTKPGFLPNKFIAGRRLSYLHPAQLYLFVTFIFFFMFSFVTSKQELKLNEDFKVVTSEMKDELVQVETDSSDKAELYSALKKTQPFTGATDKEIDSIVNKTNLNSPKKQITLGYNIKRVDSLLDINAPKEEIYKEMGMDENPN